MFSSSFNLISAIITVLSNIAVVALVASFVFRKQDWAKKLIMWTGSRALGLGFLVALGAFVGSLIYSEVIGYAPCVLCWIQRVFIYPQVVILGLALGKKDKNIIPYSIALSVLGGIVALYHAFTQLGGYSLTPCTAVGGACAKVYVLMWGYITIPTMALSAFGLLLCIMIAYKVSLTK